MRNCNAKSSLKVLELVSGFFFAQGFWRVFLFKLSKFPFLNCQNFPFQTVKISLFKLSKFSISNCQNSLFRTVKISLFKLSKFSFFELSKFPFSNCQNFPFPNCQKISFGEHCSGPSSQKP
jgi:hypothetical protein